MENTDRNTLVDLLGRMNEPSTPGWNPVSSNLTSLCVSVATKMSRSGLMSQYTPIICGRRMSVPAANDVNSSPRRRVDPAVLNERAPADVARWNRGYSEPDMPMNLYDPSGWLISTARVVSSMSKCNSCSGITLSSSTTLRASMQNSPSPSTSIMRMRAQRVFSPSQAVMVSMLPEMENRKLLSIVSAFLALMTLLTDDAKVCSVLLGTVNLMMYTGELVSCIGN